MFKIEYVNTDALIAYDKNAKKHPDAQVDRIVNSIRQFGFRQNLVIDKNNVVIIGHGRLLAARKMGLESVPCMRVEDLSDEQIKALRLADNRVAEGDWDDGLLRLELDNIVDLDMSDFGFDNIGLDKNDTAELTEPAERNIDEEDDYDDWSDIRPASIRHNVFENQETRQFPIENYYGIPVMQPTLTIGDKFARFIDFPDIKNPEEYICHFYYDDYKFMSAWRSPDKYIPKLRKFKAVVAPDFSSYTDFPIALQILGAYRRNGCGAYWQSWGLDVIPDVQWGDNEETYKWCFEGIPTNATVAISSLGVAGNDDWNGKNDVNWFKRGFDEMMRRLHPSTILWYGNMIEGCEGNIIRIPSFYEQKRQMLNERSKRKHGKT